MRQKFYVATAVVLGLTLAFGVSTMARDGDGQEIAAGAKHSVAAPGSSSGGDVASLTVERADVRATAARINKAATLLQLATRGDGSRSELLLMQVLELDLPSDDRQARNILARTHMGLSKQYETSAPVKAAHHLVLASQYADTPALTAYLNRKIADLGGSPFKVTAPVVQRTFGVADTCDAATALPSFGAIGELNTDALDIQAGGDHDWYTITIDTGDPTIGLGFRIETITDMPGNILDDDTALFLYSGCDGGTGNGLDLLDFDEDGGVGFMSLINTDCLAPGTYYLKVAGWNDTSKADNIELEVEATSSCEFIIPDALEPDNNRAEAGDASIGTAEAHSMFPGNDSDWVKFPLTETSLVSIKTACGFMGMCDDPPELDTFLSLWYASANVPVAGLCNQQVAAGVLSASSDNGCNVDSDCDLDGDGMVYPADDDLVDPFPGLPACVTWNFIPPASRPVNATDNPLAFNDDGNGLGSALELCLPATMGSPSSSVNADPASPFNWFVEVSNAGAGEYNYELLVENLGPCPFESEGNDSPETANALGLGGSVNGLYDGSASSPGPDNDFYSFDVPGPIVVELTTDGFDPIAVDTFLELWIGPDENGDFFLTGDASDDISGSDFRTRLLANLLPACEVLGNCAPAPGGGGTPPSYYVNVTSGFVVPNFPYSLTANNFADLKFEGEDILDCDDQPAEVAAPFRYISAVGDGCDFDGYRFHLDEDTNVELLTTAPEFADTTMQLYDCESKEVLGCNDDGNADTSSCGGSPYCSQMSGCLAGGRDYCVRVRAWSGASVFNYNVEVANPTPCTATEPPTLQGNTGGTVCNSFNTANGCAEDLEMCAVPLVVQLESFEGYPGKRGIRLDWTTITEIDTAGFRVLRGTDIADKALVNLTPSIIPAQGNGVEGSSYTFVDDSKQEPGTAFYWLEDLDVFGRATRHGPVIVTVGGGKKLRIAAGD